MGDLTRSQLISAVRRFFANRSDLTDGEIITWLNQSQITLARKATWEELDQTEDKTIPVTASKANDKIITLSKTYRDFYSVRLITAAGDSKRLTRLTKHQFDSKFPEPEFHARNDPSFYTYFGNKLEVFPISAEAHTLRVRGMAWPTSFTNDVVSDLDKKDDILIFLTVSAICDFLGQYDRASRFYGIANTKISEAEDEQVDKPDQEIKPDFEVSDEVPGQYWLNPFIKGMS